MAPPSSRSQYREVYTGTRHESPPVHVWQQRQMQRAQARQERAQSAQKEREADSAHSLSSHQPDDVRARVSQLESQGGEQSVRRGREDLVSSDQQQERHAQSAQRERASSSLRERQERQQRAQSALRERHQRALSAQRERQERARSAQRGNKDRHTPSQRGYQERPEPVETENHKRPQKAKTERQDRFQAAKQEYQKRIHNVQQPDSEANSRKRRGSTEPENEGKKIKVLDPVGGVPGNPESKSPFRHRYTDSESRHQCQNFIKMPSASAGSEPMNRVEPTLTGGVKHTTTDDAMNNDTKSRDQSHTPPYRKYGLYFIKKARSDGTGDDSTFHQARHEQVNRQQGVNSINSSTSGGSKDHMEGVEPLQGEIGGEQIPNSIGSPTSSEKSQPAANIVGGGSASSHHSQERPCGSPGLQPIYGSASVETSHSVTDTSYMRASVGLNSSSYLGSKASSNQNWGRQVLNHSTPNRTGMETMEPRDSADHASMHRHCSNIESQGIHARKSLTRSPGTRHEVDELGNIEVVAAGSIESESRDMSQGEMPGTTYTYRERSIHVDRSGNVEVEISAAGRKMSLRTAELIDAWSHRSTASSSNFCESARYRLRIPNSKDSEEESIGPERDRKTPIMSNLGATRKYTSHCTMSKSNFGRHSLGSERSQLFENSCDSDVKNKGLGKKINEFHEPCSQVYDQGRKNTGENRIDADMKERNKLENEDQRESEPQVPPLSQPPGYRNSHRYPTEVSGNLSLGFERGINYPSEVGDKHDEKLNNSILKHGSITPSARSKSIDQLRQRIDRNKSTSNKRFQVDPSASSDVHMEIKTCRDPIDGNEVGNATEPIQLPPTPTSSKNRVDPPSAEDCLSKGASKATSPLIGSHWSSPYRQTSSTDLPYLNPPSISINSVDQYCPSQRSHGEGLSESNGLQQQDNVHECARDYPDGDPTVSNNSLSKSGFDLPKSRDPSCDKVDMGNSCSGRQRNENLNCNNRHSHPRMVRDPQTSAHLDDGLDVKVQSNKENLTREREARVQNNSDASSWGSSSVSIRQTHRPEDTSHGRKSVGSPGLHPRLSNRYNHSRCRSEDPITDDHRDESEQDNLSDMQKSMRPIGSGGGESRAMRRNIVSKLKIRRSLGDEVSRHEKTNKVSEGVSEPVKRSKLEQIRRGGSRKSTGQIPYVVETSSMDRQGVQSVDLDTPRNISKVSDTSDRNDDGIFPAEILCPSHIHKTFGEIINGYTVWCSYGNERPSRYGSWVPPAKLFDTTYERQNEANDRAKYLFYWENPLKLEPNQFRVRCEALGEKVMKSCKSYECKLKGAPETWKVGVVPSEVFQWLDHAESHRHEFDEPCDTQSSIFGSSIVGALSMD